MLSRRNRPKRQGNQAGKTGGTSSARVAATKKKLSFKEQQELDKLPELIDELETKQAELNQQISAPEFYKKDQAVVAKTLDELKQDRCKAGASLQAMG